MVWRHLLLRNSLARRLLSSEYLFVASAPCFWLRLKPLTHGSLVCRQEGPLALLKMMETADTLPIGPREWQGTVAAEYEIACLHASKLKEHSVGPSESTASDSSSGIQQVMLCAFTSFISKSAQSYRSPVSTGCLGIALK